MPQDILTAHNDYLVRLLKKAGLDAAARDTAEQVQAVLTEELHHRMKNVLSMVTAIVRQSMRSAGSLEQAEAAITRRLVAMGRAHDLLLKGNWKAADLGEVLHGAIDQHNADAKRIHLEGPRIEAASAAILPLTLIVNELCTNAVKYGALSTAKGAVSFIWTLDAAAGSALFRWCESGGPPVTPPRARSFGSRLIESALPRQLGGSGKLDFAPSGVCFDLTVPLETLRAPV